MTFQTSNSGSSYSKHPTGRICCYCDHQAWRERGTSAYATFGVFKRF